MPCFQAAGTSRAASFIKVCPLSRMNIPPTAGTAADIESDIAPGQLEVCAPVARCHPSIQVMRTVTNPSPDDSDVPAGGP